jgi:hypothetical protein
MKVHRAILKDKKGRVLMERRFCNGIFYSQNRSYDIEMPFDDFLDRCKTTKRQAKKRRLILVCDIVDYSELWQVAIW